MHSCHIIKFAEIGDFQSYNYAYVTLNEYCAGYIPDREYEERVASYKILNACRAMADEFVAVLMCSIWLPERPKRAAFF